MLSELDRCDRRPGGSGANLTLEASLRKLAADESVKTDDALGEKAVARLLLSPVEDDETEVRRAPGIVTGEAESGCIPPTPSACIYAGSAWFELGSASSSEGMRLRPAPSFSLLVSPPAASFEVKCGGGGE